MNASKHIGIVGVSAEGAALCFRTICAEGPALLGRHAHPEISMHTYPLADYMAHIDGGRPHEITAMLLRSADKLRRAGADFLICPDNTLHQWIDLVREESPLPWLHIADEVAAIAEARGLRRVLVLGTRYLMEGPVYPAKLSARGVSHVVPDQAARERINEIIFNELVCGRFEAAARAYFTGIIEQHRARGCDAVVLGCTEIPLLVSDADSPLPALDSTRIIARAALREATGLA